MKDVKEGDFIFIGGGSNPRRSVVSTVYSSEEIEVVYIDERNRAINEDAVWRDEKWEFKHAGPVGGYADKSQRLSQYVARLRNS